MPAQQALAAPSAAASDTFTRTVKSGWGSASKGGAYTVNADKAAKLTVSGGRGYIRNLGKSKAVTTTLKSVTARDVGVKGTLIMPGTAPLIYHAYQLRTQNDGTMYRGRLDVLVGGNVNLTVSRMGKNNTEVTLVRKQLPFKATTNAAITSSFQVTGTSPVTIQGKAWIAGKAEPAWQITTADSSAARVTTAGHVRVWTYSSASNRSVIGTDEDNIVVTNNPTPPPAPNRPAPVPASTPVPTSAPTPAPVTEPTTSPAAIEPAPVAEARGSFPVGQSDYPVPMNAIHVSPSGTDTSTGDATNPLRTLAAAIKKAGAGATIVLHAGTYNESVAIPESKPNITVQAYPHEAVWLDGSVPINAWTATGQTWTTYGWNNFFDHTLDVIADNPYFVNTAKYPLASRADMVFYDGKQLTQVADTDTVTPGTFTVDEKAQTITIGSNPTGHAIAASNQMQAIYAKSTGTTLQGFGIRRYATPYGVRGAPRLGGAGETTRNHVIEDSATTGMNSGGDNFTLDHLTVTRSGMQGLAGNSSYGTRLTNSVISYANGEHFNDVPVSGGVKITRSQNLVINNNDFTNNYSFGLWLDESCYNPHITHNTITSNSGHGAEVEISANAIIADNIATGNGKSGIRLLDTSNSQIYNNTISDNGVFGIQLSQDTRRESNLSVPGHDPRRPMPDPLFSWLTENNTIANNVFGTGGSFQIYALDNWTNLPVDQWHLTITGNLFNAVPTSAQPTMVAWGGSDNVQLNRFNTPATLAAAKNPTWTNIQTPSITALASMGPATTAADATATPLPTDVAEATGQPAGTKHVGAF